MAKTKLAVIKTKQTELNVEDFINNLPDEQKRKDSLAILKMMKKATKEEPKIWGSAIIGFGMLRYKSPASGREVDWFKIGFSPRKTNLTLYLVGDVLKHSDALKKLGKHKTGSGCLYVNKLDDVDMKILEGIINATMKTKS